MFLFIILRTDNVLQGLHVMTFIRHLKCGDVFVSETLVPASEPVEPDLGVQDLVHDDVQDMMDEHEDECATGM